MHLKTVLLKPLGDYAEWRRNRMAGCYGSSPEDRYFEAMLFQYLEEQKEEEEVDQFNEEMRDAYEDLFGSSYIDTTYPSTSEK